MLRILTPIVLIGIAIASFFVLTDPLYKDVTEKRMEASSYNEALANSKALEQERDKLTAKYNTISPENLVKIKKLLPDNIDNSRLILEIGQIAAPYGMVLKNVQYSPSKDAAAPATPQGAVQGGAVPQNKDYGAWDLQFSTTGSYSNFLNFIGDLESNLRIVDISSIAFASEGGINPGAGSSLQDVYTYTFKIKTYWLKN